MASKNKTILVSKLRASLHHAGSSLMDEFQQLQDWMEVGDEEASAWAARTEDWLHKHLLRPLPDEINGNFSIDLWAQVKCNFKKFQYHLTESHKGKDE